jgi:methylglyoxal synthase
MKFALIAHDGKKANMVAFVMKRLDFFNRKDVRIVATGTTGVMIKKAGINNVELVNSDINKTRFLESLNMWLNKEDETTEIK